MNSLQHLAIIMDGNGRWAQERGLPRSSGHKYGAEALKRVVKACAEKGIKYLTVYAFSSENWKRPLPEVRNILALFEHYLRQEQDTFLKEDIRFKVIGQLNNLPASLRAQVVELTKCTQEKQKLTLQIAFDYGGRTEILDAARALMTQTQKGDLQPDELTEDLFARALYTRDIPDPDLLIRTSGEQRISNYLLWQLAYTELMFCDKYWPDFTEEDLSHAVQQFSLRERRFGRNAA